MIKYQGHNTLEEWKNQVMTDKGVTDTEALTIILDDVQLQIQGHPEKSYIDKGITSYTTYGMISSSKGYTSITGSSVIDMEGYQDTLNVEQEIKTILGI